MAKINVIISDEDKKALEDIAQAEERNLSYVVRKAIEMYLKSKQKEK